MKGLNSRWAGTFAVAFFAIAGTPWSARADWPQWRGPSFNGTAEPGKLPATISADNQTWRAPLPARAGSTPIVWGDIIFVTTPNEAKNLAVICINRQTGTQRWAF